MRCMCGCRRRPAMGEQACAIKQTPCDRHRVREQRAGACCGAATGCASRCGRGSAEVVFWRVARGGWCRGGHGGGLRADSGAPGRCRQSPQCCRRPWRSMGTPSRSRGRRCSSSRRRLRSRADVEPRGVAITQILLTEPSSALYWPAYPEELYELARAALFALGSREAASAGRWRR